MLSIAAKIRLESGLHCTSTTDAFSVKFMTGVELSICHSLTVKSAEQEMNVLV